MNSLGQHHALMQPGKPSFPVMLPLRLTRSNHATSRALHSGRRCDHYFREPVVARLQTETQNFSRAADRTNQRTSRTERGGKFQIIFAVGTASPPVRLTVRPEGQWEASRPTAFITISPE